jgi:hypothetical protein
MYLCNLGRYSGEFWKDDVFSDDSAVGYEAAPWHHCAPLDDRAVAEDGLGHAGIVLDDRP